MKTKKQAPCNTKDVEHTDGPFHICFASVSDHTPTPLRELKVVKNENGLMLKFIDGGMNTIADFREYPGIEAHAEVIVRAVNCHEELLEAAKNARNVLAGLVMGDLKEVRANSPALQSLRNAIAKAESR